MCTNCGHVPCCCDCADETMGWAQTKVDNCFECCSCSDWCSCFCSLLSEIDASQKEKQRQNRTVGSLTVGEFEKSQMAIHNGTTVGKQNMARAKQQGDQEGRCCATTLQKILGCMLGTICLIPRPILKPICCCCSSFFSENKYAKSNNPVTSAPPTMSMV